ncbi:S8 family peptidase [Thermus sediminis]|uniref:S8 family peptidase n=1 Tax=Thermus sediminis TaxID=1761908 RepID=UPI000E3D79A4|nr:S8 family serine peptidase [Thermus sediminis]
MRPLGPLLLLPLLALLLTACPHTPPPPNPAECPVGPLAAPQALEPLRLQGMGRFEGEYVPGEVLAIPAPGLSLQALKAQVAGVEPLEELPRGLVRLRVPVGQEKVKAQALLKAGMRYVQPNYVYKPLRMPNDTYYYLNQRMYLNNLVGLETAWDYSTGRGCPPLVAVLDTGVLEHEDFQKSKHLPAGVRLDVADNDADPTDRTSRIGPEAPFGHGLMVATVLGADTNNARGIAGVTWGGYVLPIKIMKDGGTSFFTSDIVDGLYLARGLGARVVNLSLGAPGFSDGAVASAISDLREAGAVIVAAAGNQAGPVFFPANLPGVVAVGAVDSAKRRASFSAYGPELDLVAPGVNVYAANPYNPRGYVGATGTSFASPIVAGVVALYMSKYASERKEWPTPDQVYTCLTGTAEDLGADGRDDYHGFGLVRADRVMTDATYCFP